MDASKKINISVLRTIIDGEGRETFSSALEDVRFSLVKRSMSTRPEEAEKREELYYICKALDEVEVQLRSYINDFVKSEENE